MRGPWIALVALLLGSGYGVSQTVTLTFVTDAGGITLMGSGTSVASLSFGSVQAFGGTIPTGVTKSTNSSSLTLSTTIDVQVSKSGLISSSYTLTGQLLSADLQNTWKFKGVTLSTTAVTITSTGAYGSTANSFSLTVPFSASAGTISNTINFIVTAN